MNIYNFCEQKMRSPEGERQRQGGRTRSPQNRQGKQILRQEIAHQYDKGKEGVYLPAPHGEGVRVSVLSLTTNSSAAASHRSGPSPNRTQNAAPPAITPTTAA